MISIRYVFVNSLGQMRAMRQLRSQSRATESYRSLLYERFEELKQPLVVVRKDTQDWIAKKHHCNDDWMTVFADRAAVVSEPILRGIRVQGGVVCRVCGRVGNARVG